MDALFELLVYKFAHLVNQPVKIWAARVTATTPLSSQPNSNKSQNACIPPLWMLKLHSTRSARRPSTPHFSPTASGW
jgi:hypothetical protein